MLHSTLALYLIGYSLTFNGPGLTYHGLINEGTSELLKNRIGKRTTLHPVEFGLTLKTEYMQYGAVYLKDSFGNNAGSVFAGPKVDLFNYFSVGAVGGLYIRESMQVGDLPYAKKVGDVDFIFLPGLTGSIKLPIKKNVSFEINVLGNYVVNHVNSGIRLDF